MATCGECGSDFDPVSSAMEYAAESGQNGEYEELYEGELCASCALSRTSSNLNLGRAMDMMNGEEAYDDDFVEKHL